MSSLSAARPPEGARAPSGGSDPHAVGERGGSTIPKVLVTKIGFDGHDRGSRVVAAGLRDAGMEVIYTPPWQEIAAVVKLAMEEDVDVIGISSLATDHLIVPKLMAALREASGERLVPLPLFDVRRTVARAEIRQLDRALDVEAPV